MPFPVDRPMRAIPSVLFLCVLGCGGATIPNTDVEDTDDNREVLEFVEEYRKAVESRDVAELLALASPDYHDDSGTPAADDDVDYEGLKGRLQRWSEALLSVRYEIRYRRVSFVRDRVLVDYTYTGSFKMKGPDGDRAERRLDENRLVLVRTGDDGFRILSGM
ncbi:MAG: hypothetical protein KC416_02575 [Myxococcales bacterium]|nr:hypothetical protein [Myxococcales bacterium]